MPTKAGTILRAYGAVRRWAPTGAGAILNYALNVLHTFLI